MQILITGRREAKRAKGACENGKDSQFTKTASVHARISRTRLWSGFRQSGWYRLVKNTDRAVAEEGLSENGVGQLVSVAQVSAPRRNPRLFRRKGTPFFLAKLPYTVVFLKTSLPKILSMLWKMSQYSRCRVVHVVQGWHCIILCFKHFITVVWEFSVKTFYHSSTVREFKVHNSLYHWLSLPFRWQTLKIVVAEKLDV